MQHSTVTRLLCNFCVPQMCRIAKQALQVDFMLEGAILPFQVGSELHSMKRCFANSTVCLSQVVEMIRHEWSAE